MCRFFRKQLVDPYLMLLEKYLLKDLCIIEKKSHQKRNTYAVTTILRK